MATADDFDPYRKWLGIPTDEQPPHHYRLLGIALFEDDPDVIENAADRQMKHVRTFQIGRNAALSQRILNELSQARVTLLSPGKAEYDAQLRVLLTPAAAPVPAPPEMPPPPPAVEATPPAVEPMSPAISIQTGAPRTGPVAGRPRMPEKSGDGSSILWILGGLLAVIGIGAAVFFSNGGFDFAHRNPANVKSSTDPKTLPEKTPHTTTPTKSTTPVPPVEPVRPPGGNPKPEPVRPTLSLDDLVKEARLALIRSDFDQATRQIDEARAMAKSDDEKTRVVHIETLHKYVNGFWDDVRQAIYALKLQDDNNQPITARFEVSGRRKYELLKREGELITYKVDGREHTSRIADLPETDAMAFARQQRGERTAMMELHLAAFMSLDMRDGRRGKNERDRARDQWRKAAELGIRDRVVAIELGLENELASAGPTTNPKTPEPRPMPTPAPKVKRLAVPSTQDLKQAESKVIQKYSAEFAAARNDEMEKRKLAKTLYIDYLENARDPATRYVSLEKAFDLAVDIGDLEKLILPMLEDFDESFEVDTHLLTAVALDRLLMQPEWHGEPAADIQKIATENAPKALREHHFAAAVKLSDVAVRSARLAMSKDAAALDRRSKEVGQFVGILATWEQAAEKGAAKLTLVSEDPTAHYQVGVMDCLGEEKWTEGLPHLAKGSDAELKAPALKELSMPGAPAEQLALAQAWADVAKQKRGLAALHVYKHAHVWAEKASLGDAGSREAATTLLQEIDMQISRLTKTFDELTAVAP